MISQTVNICAIGICAFTLNSGYFALTDIQKPLLLSAHDDNPDFNVDGYTLAGVLYSSLAISLILVPSVISLIGLRLALFIGTACYIAPPVTILLENSWLLYIAGSLNGIGTALVATATSTYLVLNSTEETLARNTALWWFFFQGGLFPGNLFTYLTFKNLTLKIDEATRHLVLFVLTGIMVTGALMVLLLREVQRKEKEPADPAWQALRRTWDIALSKNTAILLAAYGYTGLHMSFITGIYGSSIGFTLQIGEGVKRLVPLSAVLTGCGEVSGGVLVRIFGNVKIFRINVFIVLAVILNCIFYLIVFLSLPADANFGNTNQKSIIEPRIWLLLLASYFFGLGDSFQNIQSYALVGSLHPTDSASAFSVFKIVRAAFSAASFYFGRYLPLSTQLLLLTIFGTLGMITFNIVHVAHEQKKSGERH
nr:PREDICTED: UNC93-like protein MFSD11 [Bemisia tabaci]